MPPGPGSRIGPYDVLSPLGAGGMGEVYRARDSRLNRDVALKVLPEAFAADPERLARFEREAQALAALRHPHIATIYGIEEKDGVRALVLELVEGDTLDERIKRGALPVDEAARIARQIADALEAAHEQGIVHRDLKPANIKITPDGAVKVLDFGLAKLHTERAAQGAASLSMSPTMTSPAVMTGMQVLLGTVGYMAPEQARGKAVDKRADIWAFGVVVFEMLTGCRAFEGETVTEVAGAVIHKAIDLDALPAEMPPTLRMVIERCLQKDPRQRFRDMGDVRLALDGAFATRQASAPMPVAPSGPRVAIVPIAAAAVVAAIAAGAVVWALTRPEPAAPAQVQFEIPPPRPRALSPFLDISPNGRLISFIAADADGVPRVWVRPIDSTESRIVNPSETTELPTFWSPDSRSLVMSVGEKLRRVPVDGGPVETIATSGNTGGGSWSPAGTILFSNQQAILRVPASGGEPVPVTLYDLKRESGTHLFPVFLPDGKHFLYLRIAGENTTGVYVGSIDLKPEEQSQTRIIAARHNVAYLPGVDGRHGQLLFARDGLLMAQPFDERTFTVSGEAVPAVRDRIATIEVLASFAVAGDGTLIFMRSAASMPTVAGFDRAGKKTPLLGAATFERSGNPRLSPDGRRLALIVENHLWVYDMEGRPPIKLTFEGNHYSPLWTPDGQRIVFEKGGGTGRTLFVVPADGSGMPEPIGPEGHFHPVGWSADGRTIIALRVAEGRATLVRFGVGTDSGVETLVVDTGIAASVSPDGRWLAYTADTTGRHEIWVRSLTGNAAAARISPNGGAEPVWSRDGRELFYREGSDVMSVAVTAASEFNFKPPVKLFSADTMVVSQQPPSYDVAPDGRFVSLATDDAPDIPISVILNWSAAPAGGTAAH